MGSLRISLLYFIKYTNYNRVTESQRDDQHKKTKMNFLIPVPISAPPENLLVLEHVWKPQSNNYACVYSIATKKMCPRNLNHFHLHRSRS